MANKERKISLSKAIMNKHGKKKKAMKISWSEFISKMERGDIKDEK